MALAFDFLKSISGELGANVARCGVGKMPNVFHFLIESIYFKFLIYYLDIFEDVVS